MSVATSVLDHRKYPVTHDISRPKLTTDRTKKAKDEKFDPKLVAAVEAKLRMLDVDSDALNSELEAV
jgi:hypothetical protein